MRFGASKGRCSPTDSYRIGGHEQLRIFGKILGVSVHAVKDGADLQLALSELRNKHIVLIDTIGMSQRDRLVSDQIAMLSGAGQPGAAPVAAQRNEPRRHAQRSRAGVSAQAGSAAARRLHSDQARRGRPTRRRRARYA